MKRNTVLILSLAFTVAGLLTTHAATFDLSSSTHDASSESGSYPKENTFDGNTSSRWQNLATPAWIWVDLGGDSRLDTVTVKWETANSKAYHIYAMTAAQETADGDFNGTPGDPIDITDWTSVASLTNAQNSATTDTFDFVNETVTSARSLGATSISSKPVANYLLLYVTESNWGGGFTSVFEVTVDAEKLNQGAVFRFR